jgi:hypothetical protein
LTTGAGFWLLQDRLLRRILNSDKYLRGPVELSLVAEVIFPSVKVGPEDLYKQTAGKEMHERIDVIWEKIKQNICRT